MDSNAVNFADLDELVTLLRTTDPASESIRSITVDENKVNVPGLWIRVDGFTLSTLAGTALNLSLFLIVGDQDQKRALAALGPMFNLIKPVLEQHGGPAGPVTTTAVALPGSSTPLPALQVPFDLLTTQE